ncbi:alpha-(1,3)-fucosyltransferase C [Tetranychus urticae]|uniref:Fucosyltransferase n=1 Tax=Tetranychus urticae TaxID=32264 RepID=T1K3Q2_TETUR|nr:alpha-(1,3)-fucosyltransferase C [Tetranychus urticae]
MSIKRSKLLIAILIALITVFLLIQLVFQKSHPLPQIPPIPTSVLVKSAENLSSEDNVIGSDVKSIPNQSIQKQPEETIPDLGSPNLQYLPTIDDHQAKISPLNGDGTNVAELPHSSQTVPRTFQILLWTDFFSQKNYVRDEWRSNCDYTNCRFTSNRSILENADGLIFHARDINISDLPNKRKPEQRWIFLNHESPAHTSFSSLSSLDGLINWTATYRLDSDFKLSPLFVPVPTVLPKPFINNQRPGIVSWLVSNCHTPSNREAYVEELSKYIPVDIYGACGNHTCLPKMSQDCYKTLADKYYFYLSFENSICSDYVTEKFFFIMNYPIVPIVFGGADYKKIAPSNSFIDALSYESPRSLAEYLKHLLENPDDYNSYFNWKRFYTQSSSHYACQICKALNKEGDSKKTWDKLSEWWFGNATCYRWDKNKLIQSELA